MSDLFGAWSLSGKPVNVLLADGHRPAVLAQLAALEAAQPTGTHDRKFHSVSRPRLAVGGVDDGWKSAACGIAGPGRQGRRKIFSAPCGRAPPLNLFEIG